MKKYIFKINISGYSPATAKTHLEQLKKSFIDNGMLGPFDKVFFLAVIDGESSVTIVEYNIVEAIIQALCGMCGKLHKFAK